jgi:hypothetical protein
MTKPTVLAVLLLLFVPIVSAPIPSSADQDRGLIVQEQERLFFERATTLRRNIQPGWSHEAVAGIMGPPNATRHAQDGPDYVETWWYHDYEVGIEFRNGAVSHWFFRFMLR